MNYSIHMLVHTGNNLIDNGVGQVGQRICAAGRGMIVVENGYRTAGMNIRHISNIDEQLIPYIPCR